MSNTFLVSDTHFGHVGVTKFLKSDGVTKLRPWDNIEEMDEALVGNWNSVVKPEDKIYHLGDVVINRWALKTLERLNGRKILIKGNHDIFKLDEYTPYFDDIRGSHKLDEFVLTHIPVHPSSLYRWKGNLHGHLHDGAVMKEAIVRDRDLQGNLDIYTAQVPDPRYLCLSVENINYTPISFEDARKKFNEQQ